MKQFGHFFILFLLFLSACGPKQISPGFVIPLTVPPSGTATQVATSFPTGTPSPTPIPSSTPDLRILQGAPPDFVMLNSDLPTDAGYYLPNAEWTGMVPNDKILQEWPPETGQAYLDATGRVDGMFVGYNRSATTVAAPQEMTDSVVIFKTAVGAQLTLTQFDTKVAGGYFELTDPPRIGDLTRAYTIKLSQPSGGDLVHIGIAFTYRNIYHYIEGNGLENDVTLDYITRAARTVLDRMMTLPLVSP